MNIVYIRGLRAQAVIGVYDWERHIRQTLVLDLEMASDTARAAASDQIADALDYAAVVRARSWPWSKAANSSCSKPSPTRWPRMITREFGVPWLRLRLGKPGAVAEAEDVGVIIEAGERP